MLARREFSTNKYHIKDDNIYILGIGNIGKLIAHSLATNPDSPPITLLFHRAELAKEYDEAQRCIEIITCGISNKQKLFSIEVLPDEDSTSRSVGNIIHNLIVTTKANRTTSGLARIRDRLNHESNILFTQNGMGT